MTTEVTPDVEITPEQNTGDDPSKQAHYYDTKKYNFYQARANGTPIVALCGYKWIPQVAGPKDLPVCAKCLYLAENVCKP
jgi:hypothetical protein